MRIPLLLAAIGFLTASPAVAQQAAEEPVDLLTALGMAPDPERVRAAIEAAQGHPLGTSANPVRVGGPGGERAYIARLRCSDGQSPRVGQRSSAGIGPFGTIVDLYPLDCGAAAPGRFELVMDMYHPRHGETRAPGGFTLVP